MRYLGGKWRIARRIVNAIVADVGYRPRHALELCSGAGGLTRLLAEACGRVTAIEAHVGLVRLLRDVQGGFVPPTTVTREEHAASTDPTDPLHAFRRFACSHGGAWDGYYLPDEPPREYATHRGGVPFMMHAAAYCHAASGSRALVRDSRANVTHVCGDALTCEVPDGVDVIYADPPYEETRGYACVDAAEAGAWWRRLSQLATTTRVPTYMSEAAQPPVDVPARLVLRHVPGQRRMNAGGGERIELLWRLLPR